jgi:hypothetical protein
MRSMLLLAILCIACTPNDAQLEADSASAANAIKGKFARAKFVADSTEKARKDSLARIGKQHADSEYAVAFAAIRKLAPDSFDLMPAVVRSTLRERGCLIPQFDENGKHNAIEGAFTAKGTSEWAVICALPTSTQALILNAGTGSVVDSLAVAIDRAIEKLSPAGIAEANHDEGSPIPGPIDHDAIDVAILEKASVAYYRAGGKWYQVMTSD